MRKNINKKIFLTAVLTCCITLVWACAAMAENTRIKNKTAYQASGSVKYKKKHTTSRCNQGDSHYVVESGGIWSGERQSGCNVEHIYATLHNDGKTTTCEQINGNMHEENFEIRGDMNKCKVFRSQ